MEPTDHTEDGRTDEFVEEEGKAEAAIENLVNKAAKVPEKTGPAPAPDVAGSDPPIPSASPIIHLSAEKGLAFLEFDIPVQKVSLTPKLCHQLGKRLIKLSRNLPG